MPMTGLNKAAELMRAGHPGPALAQIDAVLRTGPAPATTARCWSMKGVIARLSGDGAEARRCQIRALAIAPALDDAATELARLFNAGGQPVEAIRCTRDAAAAARPSQALLVERARAWQALDRAEERVAERRRIAVLYPGKAATHHNLASALGDAGHAAEAEAQARKAIALGGPAPETRLVLARALQSQTRFDEAEAAFVTALTLRPGYFDALRDLAQLAWMRGDGIDAVLARIETHAAGMPRSTVAMLQSSFLASAGMPREGYAALLAAIDRGDPQAQAAAAALALPFDAAAALVHARQGAALAPTSQAVRRVLADALLASHEASAALALVEEMLSRAPLDQGLVAARWTAWRLLEDPRAAELYDYARVVRSIAIAAPQGWSDREAYLADLRQALHRLHRFDAHPLDQSLRGGSQTASNLLLSHDPALKALPEALAPAIETYLHGLGTGTDVLRARLGKGRRFAGMWSVRLRPGGRHLPHVHPQGWISSALHVDLPENSGGEREGWLEFGRPGVPDLEAQLHVQPAAGNLVLFPSCMWHSTVAFTGQGYRTSIAFDIVPALPGA
ncbi:putative 2OG-Fe(II) oxygenase [Novosphingobium resinovorum]|uniref:putative 2OG-Fe(II) oxygenase n=1 Tax=Novosphingobium resinovorum TaxID=158500 RepID=UPI002ED68F76|nr:putative 2OG-Fe(II) oxygenase [Novosphingobium resinovorum]